LQPNGRESAVATTAFLYDATAPDRQVELTRDLVEALHDQQLLWIDASECDDTEIRRIGTLLKLNRESVYNLLRTDRRPRLENYGAYFQLNADVLQEEDGAYTLAELHFVIGSNLVLTLHRKPVDFLTSFDDRIKGDSELGQLDAPAFLAALLDWHVTSYFRIIESLERHVDRLDANALRPRHKTDLLIELARLRQRVGHVRRTLTPHREVYAALVRPDFHLLAGSGSVSHFEVLNERLERAIESVENARELLIGSFDIFTTQTTLRTNETIKVLTLVSVVLLPASLLVSLASLLVRAPVYNLGRPGFWLMLFAIAALAVITYFVARTRRWI
jgi:Mg2+ and Co2+ transporter CorA